MIEYASHRLNRQVRALHVIAGLAPAHGGPSYSVPRLCEALSAHGAAMTLLSVDMGEPARLVRNNQFYHDYRFSWDYARVPFLGSLRCSSGLAYVLSRSAADVDVIHDHGLWLLPNVTAGRVAQRFRKPFVVSPRGMLAPEALAFSSVKKRVFWSLLQGAIVRRAACLHATSEQEYCEIREFGLGNPVVIIPNGIDLPEITGSTDIADEKMVLALGRIHPKKGLDVLIRAWALIAEPASAWQLKIVGPAEAGHDSELRSLVQSLALTNVSIQGPIYGEAKFAALREADFFVLPSRNENFGLTVAEALAACTPVISTKGTPWSGLESEGCGWWVDYGVEPLAIALARAMAMPRETLKAMGAKGRDWMARDFSWARVAADMIAVYSWLAKGDDPPPTVRFT